MGVTRRCGWRGVFRCEQLPQACNLLGRFISIREANIRYRGLDTMARLSQEQPHTLDDLKKHQSTILFSLKDQDISIRRRALDLVYSMCVPPAPRARPPRRGGALRAVSVGVARG